MRRRWALDSYAGTDGILTFDLPPSQKWKDGTPVRYRLVGAWWWPPVGGTPIAGVRFRVGQWGTETIPASAVGAEVGAMLPIDWSDRPGLAVTYGGLVVGDVGGTLAVAIERAPR